MDLNKQYELIKMLNGLFKKGYTLQESLIMLALVNKRVIKIRQLLDQGTSFGNVLKKQRFIKLVYETVEIGETANRLYDVFHLIENYLEFYLRIKSQVNKVLMYPFMLLVTAIVSIEFIRIKLYPVLTSLLSEFQVSQNPLILFFSFNLLKLIGFCLLIMGVLIYFFRRIPNLLPLVKLYHSLYVTHHLKILLACGNSLDTSFQTLEKTLNKKIYDFNIIRNSLFDKSNPNPLFGAFSPIFLYFFKLGLKSNNIIHSLTDFTEIYFDTLTNKLTKVIYHIQFVIFAILAINIILIYYVVMIPMFSITQTI